MRQRRAQHVLVEGAREVGVDQLPVVQRLAHHPPHEAEVVQVADAAVVLHVAVGVGLEGGAALGHRHEQRQVGVEHLARHHLVPLARHAARVNALLALAVSASCGVGWGCIHE